MEDNSQKRRKQYGGAQRNPLMLDCSHEDPMPLPSPMVGPFCSANRRLPLHATGPPFIYFENVAQAPKGVWDTISTYLYGIKSEIVDSKFFSAATRKREYVYSLPVDSRSALRPILPKTIFEAFPCYEKSWPSWDPRRQLNCLRGTSSGLPNSHTAEARKKPTRSNRYVQFQKQRGSSFPSFWFGEANRFISSDPMFSVIYTQALTYTSIHPPL